MNETPSAKKKEPMQMPEKNPRTSKKTRKHPDGDEFPYIGEYDVPDPSVPNRAHTEM